MKISKLRTLWIMLLGGFYTLYITSLSIIQHVLGTTNRPWVDKTIQKWAHRLLKLMHVHYKVFNPYHVEPIQGQATIVMCNHSSLLDIPLSMCAFPHHSLRMLAKKEMSYWPLFGQGMKAAEFLFIDRKNKRQAIQDLEKVKELMNSGIVMWIAPEGTRTLDGKLAPFKKGAFITAIQSKATIIPIGIQGAFDILPAKTFELDMDQTAEIHIGKPIDAAQYTIEDKDELIKVVHEAVQNLTNPNSSEKKKSSCISQ